MMSDYKTYLVVTVFIPSASNTPDRRYMDGSPLRKIVHREINAPPLFVPDMRIMLDEGWEKVSSVGWDENRRVLSLFCYNELSYYDQGPKFLSDQEKIIAYFDGYIQSYLDDGWVLGNPPRE